MKFNEMQWQFMPDKVENDFAKPYVINRETDVDIYPAIENEYAKRHTWTWFQQHWW